MFSLSEIEAVLAVARHGSFRSAAIAVGLSRSALSHAVASFEKRLDVRLFHRTTRSVALTEAGRRFVSGADPALAEIKACIDDVSASRKELAGTLRINAFAPAARWIIEPIFLKYMRHHPSVKLDIVTDGRLIDIVKEGFDAGIRLNHAVPLDMTAIDLGHELKFVLVGSPDYFAQHGEPVHPNDLAGHRCIRNRAPSGKISPWQFEREGEGIDVSIDGPATLDDLYLILDAAKAGVGLAYVPEWDVAQLVASGSVRQVMRDWMPPASGISLYYPGRRHTPAVLRALVELVKNARR